MVRTRLPLEFAVCEVVSLAVELNAFGSSLVLSPLSAAKATGAERRQPTTAAGKIAWRVRIFTEEVEVSPDQAHGSYRQGGGQT